MLIYATYDNGKFFLVAKRVFFSKFLISEGSPRIFFFDECNKLSFFQAFLRCYLNVVLFVSCFLKKFPSVFCFFFWCFFVCVCVCVK